MAKEDGGSAFPSEQPECQDNTWNQTFDPGMSLRDWFAGQALVSVLSALGDMKIGRDNPAGQQRAVAMVAYDIADAMIAQRTEATP